MVMGGDLRDDVEKDPRRPDAGGSDGAREGRRQWAARPAFTEGGRLPENLSVLSLSSFASASAGSELTTPTPATWSESTDSAGSSTSLSTWSTGIAESAGEWSSRVGVVYSQHMLLHKCRGHEERPERILKIRRQLGEAQLWDQLTKLPAREATQEELLTVHTKGYLRKMNRLNEACMDAPCEAAQTLADINADTEDVYFNEHTIRCARLAAGASIDAAIAVSTGAVSSAMAIVRPPGHHAERHCAQGFCVFNNIALAARAVLDTTDIERVLIVDWDVHHGNGTQNVVLDDPRIMYFSTHRYDHGKFYPSSRAAGPDVIGEGDAEGTNINVAWQGGGHGDRAYLAAWEEILLPKAKAFQPELILVSAGFDAAKGDAMGGCEVTPRGYALMTRHLTNLAGGKVVLVLEGGYETTSLARSVEACVTELLKADSNTKAPINGLEPEALDELDAYAQKLRGQSISDTAKSSLRATKQAHGLV